GARLVTDDVTAVVPLNVDIGALYAALAEALIALLRGLMVDIVRIVHDVRPLSDSPILATIPAEKSDHAVMPMPDLERHGRNAEAYRELRKIGRASCRERRERWVVAASGAAKKD